VSRALIVRILPSSVPTRLNGNYWRLSMSSV